MASSLIHMVVAKKINRVIKRDYDKIMLGSVAPDLSKLIGEGKEKSHFLDNDQTDIPNIEKFLDKYKDYLNDDFVMGYFIHLYTDYLWFKYFIPEIFNKDTSMITKLDGSVVKCSDNMFCLYIYNDYTNMNSLLIDEYKLDLKVFYKRLPQVDNIISEIPMDKLDVLTNAIIKIIDNTKLHKDFVFDLTNIKSFIKSSTDLTIAKIKEIENNNKVKK